MIAPVVLLMSLVPLIFAALDGYRADREWEARYREQIKDKTINDKKPKVGVKDRTNLGPDLIVRRGRYGPSRFTNS